MCWLDVELLERDLLYHPGRMVVHGFQLGANLWTNLEMEEARPQGRTGRWNGGWGMAGHHIQGPSSHSDAVTTLKKLFFYDFEKI